MNPTVVNSNEETELRISLGQVLLPSPGDSRFNFFCKKRAINLGEQAVVVPRSARFSELRPRMPFALIPRSYAHSALDQMHYKKDNINNPHMQKDA